MSIVNSPFFSFLAFTSSCICLMYCLSLLSFFYKLFFLSAWPPQNNIACVQRPLLKTTFSPLQNIPVLESPYTAKDPERLFANINNVHMNVIHTKKNFYQIGRNMGFFVNASKAMIRVTL